MRIGNGYDVHALVTGRELILGGVKIPYEYGLMGHSDADVLTHAVMDALLGAAALGDIGTHFSDSDPAYQGANSIALLRAVGALLLSKGYRAVNLDAVVVAQRPRLMPHIPQMVSNIAQTLNIPQDCVSVKATTTEGLGFEGEGKGMAAYAVCLIENI